MCMCLWGRGHVLYISHARCVSVSMLLLSTAVAWKLLKGDRSGWRAGPAGLQGALREMCWAPSQRGSHPQRRGPSLQVIVEYQKETCYSFLRTASRCSIQQGRDALRAFFFSCVHTCLCLWYHAFSTASHPSLPSP